MKFHSPYQFIGIKKCEHKTDYENQSDLKKPTNFYVRHDRWHKDSLSGRICCTLKTETPLVIGARQYSGTNEKPGKVEPYTHKNHTPAIPANSLRGMIASIVETLSQSSLRILASEQACSYTTRKEVNDPLKEIGVLYKALSSLGGKNTLPWNQNRNELTPAECLFGVVEDEPKEKARNLTSRIQITDAISTNKIELLSEITLKILDSPKPPSPAMYFNDKQGNHITKAELDLNKHAPNGRKHYIPQPNADSRNWTTKHNQENPPSNGWQQYLKCTPIPETSEFQFQIHFENLSKEELGLLQTAIQPSDETESFYHRLGLGKPLGLGQITLKIEKIEVINRIERYSLGGLRKKRYQQYNDQPSLKLVDTDTLELLKTLYNPKQVEHPVCYPFNGLANQTPYNENEGFSWFVKNDKLKPYDPKKQKLSPIKANQKIPTLDSFKD